jgi:putative ABC transport system permease protein
VVRTALAEPVRNRFRTGTTVGLFMLVVFTMVSGASISASFMNALDDEESFGGGFDLTGQTSPMSPIRDMDKALETVPDLERSAITSYAAQSYLPVEAKQVGETDSASYLVRGLDEEFMDSTTYGFAARAAGYDSDEQVWDALASQHGLAVVDAYSVPRRSNFGTTVVSDFRLSGMALEDQGFTPVEVDVSDPQSGRTIRLTVIGVLADSVPFAMLGISTSQASLTSVGASAVPSVWYFRTAPGVDPVDAAGAIEAAFLGNGMQAKAQSEVLHDAVSTSITFQYLVLGFLGLGLVIGVAALGVISARSVVERRQQIGVLRALGFQARMVQTSFLVESLFVTLIGIVNGTVLGLIVANSVIQDTAEQPGWSRLELAPPWVALLVILGVVAFASLVATWLPSVRASRTYPAAALRYQ